MWKSEKIEDGKVYKLNLGTLDVSISRSGKNTFLQKNITPNKNEYSFSEVEEPIDLLAADTFVVNNNGMLGITTAIPDKPIRLKPDNGFKLLPKSTIQLYIPIHLSLMLYDGEVNEKRLLFKDYTQVPTKTWLGEPDDGTLAHSVKFAPFICKEVQNIPSYLCLCPLKITNESNTILDFQHFLLHTEYLSLYLKGNTFYASAVHIKFKGENLISDLQYLGRSSEVLKGAKKIAGPESTDRLGAIKRSFYFMRSLTQY